MTYRNNKNQIKMISGKMYSVLGEITLLPEMYFPYNKYSIDSYDYRNILSITKDSKPNFFMFTNHVYDNHRTVFAKVLYKNRMYIIQNEYHIGNLVKLLT